MRRQRPANTKMCPPTPRHHPRQRPANKPPTRQHPAPPPPTPPLRACAATGTARAPRIRQRLRWRSARGRTLRASPIQSIINLAGKHFTESRALVLPSIDR